MAHHESETAGQRHSRRAPEVDAMIGANLRRKRVEAGLTQQRLAEKVGVTYQQLHKYENGGNRIAASRLLQVAQVLGVDVAAFYGEDSSTPPEDRSAVELMRDYHALSGMDKHMLRSLCRRLAGRSS